MKKTMRFLSMAALALVGAVMTGCSSDDITIDTPQQPASTDNVVTLTTTISLDGGSATTRALTPAGVKTFAVGDQIAVFYYDNGNYGYAQKALSDALTIDDIHNGGKTADFKIIFGDAPGENKQLRYVYPANMAKGTIGNWDNISNDANTIDFKKLNAQNGTLATLGSDLDLCVYDGNFSGTQLPASATLTNRLAILAITLKDNAATPSEITSDITGMTVSDGTNTYTVTREAAAGPIYVAIQPTTSTDIEVTATDGTKNYTKSLTGKTYSAGNGYSLNWRMTEVPAGPKAIAKATAEDIGKVVCAAGHLHDAKTTVPAGCTAVGILGKVTETGHGLILALQDATNQTWYTINGWTSVTTYAGTTLKLLPDDTARGSLTSYTTLGSTTVSNWCVAQKADYSAIFTNLGSEKYDSDGYTYDDNVNAFITGIGGTAISGSYWSATEYDDGGGYCFESKYWNYGNKGYPGRLRPVLAF